MTPKNESSRTIRGCVTGAEGLAAASCAQRHPTDQGGRRPTNTPGRRPPNQHVIDAYPERFGWRFWLIDPDGTRLISPIHHGSVDVGHRFIHAPCAHTPEHEAFALDRGCGCGVYFFPYQIVETDTDRSVESPVRVMQFMHSQNPGRLALTFGAAVGDVHADPTVPEKASRTRRWRILAIVLPEKSETGGALQQRYGVTVHMGKPPCAETFEYVEKVVRAELRNQTPETFFNALRDERTWQTDNNPINTHPNQFGWRLWHLVPEQARITAPFFRDARTNNEQVFKPTWPLASKAINGRLRFEAKCPHRNPIPSRQCTCGISYWLTTHYMLRGKMRLGEVTEYKRAGYWDVPWCYTFGFSDHITKDDWMQGGWRAKHYTPTLIMIPDILDALTDKLYQRYGDVDIRYYATGPDRDPVAEYRQAELDARNALAGIDPAELFDQEVIA